MQDLKEGKMVGATPWKQQVMLLVGVMISALVVGPVLNCYLKPLELVAFYPTRVMDPTQVLSAPQSGLIATIAQGALGGALPWFDINIGIGIAFVAIIVDELLKKTDKRLRCWQLVYGIYLPPEITSALIIGGILNYICKIRLLSRSQD